MNYTEKTIQNEPFSLVRLRSKELLLVQENPVTVKPNSSVIPRAMETSSKSKIELYCEIYKS